VAEEVEVYLKRMAEIHATGSATSETSYYGALENLLNSVGKNLKPRVICNGQIRNQGAGHPDFGLYTQNQCNSGVPKEGQGLTPERGVVEVKGLADETWKTVKTPQISKYWDRSGLVLVTNYRDFLIVGVNGNGKPVRLESFSLAASDRAFWQACAKPKQTATATGAPFVEYLKRALAQLAPLSRPADLAWLLASYARDALARVEKRPDLDALAAIRSGLEEALGLKFKGEKGEHFFRSTLIQTLFYGVFSAWVQWCKDQPVGSTKRFDWHAAGWSLHVPMIKNLFEQIATPTRLGPLNLVEVLDWTGDALNRVDRVQFFHAFDQGRAVQYFYEPFLAAFDPELRKQLGVWYTPPEIVQYMVARVDRILQTELGVADGLAAPNVYVLDPCCGTGSFVVETLNVIAKRLHQQGGDALLAHDLKQAAMKRVFGFEIMPAPFVIAHWQIGLRLADAGAPLGAGTERAAVYLTNALTGWQPPKGPKQHLMFPELEEERDAAEHVKRDVPILVIIGNPPYNAFAGTSPVEEEGLVEPYKTGLQKDWGIRKFNLDELYVRFLRVAERRIVDSTGRGIVCFISSYSYLSDASFVVVHAIWVDSLNGDSRETGKLTPDGNPDPSVFSTEFNREGIKLGTAIGIFVRRNTAHSGAAEVRYRDFWGTAKREELRTSLNHADFEKQYVSATPVKQNRFSLRPWSTAGAYATWPTLMELASAEPFSGLSEKRRGALISFDQDELAARMMRYLDPNVSFATVKAARSGPVEPAAAFDPEKARATALKAEPFRKESLRRIAMHPMDVRWCYHTTIGTVWNRSRPELAMQARDGNLMIASRMSGRRPDEGLPITVTTALVNHHLLDPNAHVIPARIQTESKADDLFSASTNRANLSEKSRHWLKEIGWPDPDGDTKAGNASWFHAVAICCSPKWLEENHSAILTGWPRVPLPSSATALKRSAALGARLAVLLDPDQPASGITTGTLEPPFRILGVMARSSGKTVKPEELAVTAGWGHGGGDTPVMPSQGHITERSAYTDEELAELKAAAKATGEKLDALIARLGPPTDIWLNDVAYWRCVPTAVWKFSIGGYQVFKKWLSYREQEVFGRPLSLGDAREATAIVRRLAAIILLQRELDENYEAIKDASYAWPETD
jgi:hypothetical protein